MEMANNHSPQEKKIFVSLLSTLACLTWAKGHSLPQVLHKDLNRCCGISYTFQWDYHVFGKISSQILGFLKGTLDYLNLCLSSALPSLSLQEQGLLQERITHILHISELKESLHLPFNFFTLMFPTHQARQLAEFLFQSTVSPDWRLCPLIGPLYMNLAVALPTSFPPSLQSIGLRIHLHRPEVAAGFLLVQQVLRGCISRDR